MHDPAKVKHFLIPMISTREGSTLILALMHVYSVSLNPVGLPMPENRIILSNVLNVAGLHPHFNISGRPIHF